MDLLIVFSEMKNNWQLRMRDLSEGREFMRNAVPWPREPQKQEEVGR